MEYLIKKFDLIYIIKLAKKNFKTFFLISYIELAIIGILLSLLMILFGGLEHNDIIDENIYILFIGTLILAPIFETYFFQHLIYKLLKADYKRPNFKKYVIYSSLGFSFIHIYGFKYIIYAFILGLFLAYFYFVVAQTKKYPFIYTALLHSLLNLSFIILNEVIF